MHFLLRLFYNTVVANIQYVYVLLGAKIYATVYVFKIFSYSKNGGIWADGLKILMALLSSK